ncbi:MAG: hypothetical protein ACYSVY_04270 [Planctomycetota bacterium]
MNWSRVLWPDLQGYHVYRLNGDDEARFRRERRKAIVEDVVRSQRSGGEVVDRADGDVRRTNPTALYSTS